MIAAVIGPIAFVTVFAGSLGGPSEPASTAVSGTWPHAHVLLASAGLSLLGLAGLAGVIFLIEHRLLKSKKSLDRRLPLPSLEALDRVNAVTLSVGFLVLTLGVITGMIWLQTAYGRPWSGSAHETWSFVAWVVYAALVVSRFVKKQGSRHAAASAVGAFVFLLFAVIGLEFVS